MADDKKTTKLERSYEHDICMLPCTDEDVKRAKEYMVNNREKWIRMREEGKKDKTWTKKLDWQYKMQMGKGLQAFINNVIMIRKSVNVSEDAEIFRAQMEANIEPLYTELFSGYEYGAHEMAIITDKLVQYSKLPEVDMENPIHRESLRSIIDTDLRIRRMNRKVRDSNSADMIKTCASALKDAERENRQAKIDLGLINKKGAAVSSKPKTLKEKEEERREEAMTGLLNKHKKTK